MGTAEIDDFVECLPPQLKMLVSYNIHKDLFVNDPFFNKFDNRRLLSFFGM